MDEDIVSQWILEDFRDRRREIELRQNQREKLVNYALIALAGITALFSAMIRLSPGQPLGIQWIAHASSVASVYFSVLCLVSLRHSLYIQYNARYVNRLVEKRLREKLPDDVMDWEQYIRDMRHPGTWIGKVLHFVLDNTRLLLLFLPALGFFIISIGMWHTAPEHVWLVLLLVLNALLLVGSFALGCLLRRIDRRL